MKQRVKRVCGYVLCYWPLPLSFWYGIHLNGWKVSLIVWGAIFLAVGVLALGFYLIISSKEEAPHAKF